MGLIEPTEKRRHTTVAISLLACVALVAMAVLFAPFLTQPTTAIALETRRDSILVQAQKTAEIMGCQAEIAHGRVPEFNSSTMPDWWSRHSKGLLLDPEVEYRVPPELAGRKLNELSPDQVLLTASGKPVLEQFGRSPVAIQVNGKVAP